MKSFGSDNHSGVHPRILEAITEANLEHHVAYGDDSYTKEAEARFKTIFGKNSASYFVFTGTAANVLSLSSNSKSYQGIICTESAHIQTDECGAPEKYSGCKLLTVPSYNGKMDPKDIKPYLSHIGFQHHSQPAIISISQGTELGTVYSIEEIKRIADIAHQNNLLLHIDGARLANACAFLKCNLSDCTISAGADILSFGGTKNGLMYGEAIVFADAKLAEGFPYIRKQAMQLASKMRYISSQFIAYLSNEQWRVTALHANSMAKLMEEKLKVIDQVKITRKVETNAIFATLPENVIKDLQKEFCFYIWNDRTLEVRWMTSWDTTPNDIDNFVRTLSDITKQVEC